MNTHWKARLKTFFKTRVNELKDTILQRNLPHPILFDYDDIKNAINYTYEWVDSTRRNALAQEKLEVLL